MRENCYYDLDKFQDLVVIKVNHHDNCLFLEGKLMDLDIFLDRLTYFDYPNYPLKNTKCSYLTVFGHAQDLFPFFL